MSKRRTFNIYRDGLIHVCERMCETCIYRSDSPLMETPIKAQAVQRDTGVVCHSTLGTKRNAVCRGFYNQTPTRPLVMAKAMGLIRFQEVE